MAAITNQPEQHWREAAIARSEIITDSWEVTKSYAGRLAEWILFLCMIANIIEMLPGVTLAPWFTNTVLGVQVVMLDIGGFSLATMADHARSNGNEDAAKRASITGWFLIGLMMVTLLTVAVGVLFPTVKPTTDDIEKGLILLRVVMTVVYGHVIHSLRRNVTPLAMQPIQPVQIEQIDELKAQIAELATAVNQVNLSMLNFTQENQHGQENEQSGQTYTTICTDVQALKMKIDSVHAPVHALNLLDLPASDEQEAISEQPASEDIAQPEEQISSDVTQVDESAPEEDAPLVYPFVPGIAEEVVKQIIDLHLSGVAWSAVGTKLSKNYSRIVKPVRDAYTQANSGMDTDRQPVQINLYRQAVL